LSIFVQPERMRVFKDFNWYIFSGKLLRLVQSFKFIRRILLRSPMDWCILDKFGQSFMISFSRFGSFEKSGLFFKYLEWLRLRILSFSNNCNKIKVLNKS
jgi:hypothetical protein